MINIHHELYGEYEICVMRKGRIVRALPKFKNLITDIGLDQIGLNRTNSYGIYSYAFAGSGNTPPANSDVTMQSLLGETNTVTVDTSESTFATPRYYVYKTTWSFPIGSVVGNVSEVGIGWKPNASTRSVFSRALVVDGGGAPTTITVLATEQLVLTYRLYVKISDTDVVSNVSDGTTNYTVTRRANYSNSMTGFSRMSFGVRGDVGNPDFFQPKETDVLPALGTNWAIAGDQSEASILDAYVAGSFQQAFRFTIPGNLANYSTGIGSACAFTRHGSGSFMFSFSPKISKTVGQSIRLSLIQSWGRGTPP